MSAKRVNPVRRGASATSGRVSGNGPEGSPAPRKRAPQKAPRVGASGSARVQMTRIEVDASRGVFMISVAAELANMHPQTLRMYEARGLVEPKRSPKGTRLYSQQDVERLRRIHEMTVELGLNLAGVQRVLDLESEVQSMNARIEELELQALRAQVELAEELEQVRRSFRAELVPFPGSRPPGTALVRAADARSPFRVPPLRGNRAGSEER